MGLVSFEKAAEQEIDGKKYIENKEVGLKFAVPQGWETEKTKEGVSMHSPDFVSFAEDSFFIPQKGCWIEAISEILKNNDDYDWEYGNLKLMIENQDYLAQENSYKERNLEVIELSGLKAIRSDRLEDSNQENIGNFIYAAIPYKNLLYVFATYIFGENKDACLQEFNNFLTTVIIKK